MATRRGTWKAGLGWSLDDLADASGISRRTVTKFEGGGKVLPETVETFRSAFVKEGLSSSTAASALAFPCCAGNRSMTSRSENPFH